MATHSSILAWRIPWTEKPGGLRSMGSNELDTAETTQHAQAALERRGEAGTAEGGDGGLGWGQLRGAWAAHPSPVSLSVDLTAQYLWGRESGLETEDELGKREGQVKHAVGGHRDSRPPGLLRGQSWKAGPPQRPTNLC